MSDQKRPYRKKRRAELEAQTRQRIVESAIDLHGSVGPSQASMSAIAERAGVRRSTLYRHFPDEAAVYMACSAHWLDANPRPDLARWAGIEDPDERLRDALEELYRYYRRTEGMLANLHRDQATVPIVKRLFGAYHGYVDAAAETLMRGRRARGRGREMARAAIGHGLAFTTWRSLAREQGLDDARATEFVCLLVGAIERRPRKR